MGISLGEVVNGVWEDLLLCWFIFFSLFAAPVRSFSHKKINSKKRFGRLRLSSSLPLLPLSPLPDLLRARLQLCAALCLCAECVGLRLVLAVIHHRPLRREGRGTAGQFGGVRECGRAGAKKKEEERIREERVIERERERS